MEINIITIMPNHCNNIIHCKHDDDKIIQRLKEALSRDPPVFFAEFVPCPENDSPISYWGTKWDVYDVNIDNETEHTLQISFYTAWSPPTEAYARLQKLGFTIDAMFMETGCDFCGYWRNGEETVFENVSNDLSVVPEDFHFYFNDSDEENDKDE